MESGQTTLRNVNLIRNRALVAGGGCYINHDAQVAFEGGRVEQNTSDDGGGGIINFGRLQLTGTTITRNTAAQEGGGIFNLLEGTVTFLGAHVNNNAPDNCKGTTSCPP